MLTDEQAQAEIRRGLDMLYRAGDIVELRVPRRRSENDKYSANTSGYFDDMDALAYAINFVNKTYKQTCYVMMNPLKPGWPLVNNRAYVGSKQMQKELEAAGLPLEPRMKKSVLWETGKVHFSMRMAEDDDILRRAWILIDIDAGQPADTNSTDAELSDTLAMAKAVREFLISVSFPAGAFAMSLSGNGTHLYLRVDLCNTPESTLLVRRFLQALGQKFAGAHGTAAIDEAMYNAGRITKAAGSMVFKGPDTPERPCRRSAVIELAGRRSVSIELIEDIADKYTPGPGEAAPTVFPWDDSALSALDGASLQKQITRVQQFLSFYEIESNNPRKTGDDFIIPVTCPKKAGHTMDGGPLESVVMIGKDGAVSFCCMHAHCIELRTWKGFRTYLETTFDKKYQWWDVAITPTQMSAEQIQAHLASTNPVAKRGPTQ
jgi:hypothetical protein